MFQIKIKCHDFLPPSSWGSPVTSDYAHAQSSNKHPLAHILGTCALIFSSLQFTPTASHHSPGDTPPEHGSKEHRNKAKTQSSTHAPWLSVPSYRSLSLPKATCTPFIQPHLGVPSAPPSLTSAINTLLTIRYSSILSTCPNHLNTLWAALLANSIQSLLSTSSFLILSIHDTPTKHLKPFHLEYIYFPSLSTSDTQCLCSIQRRWYNYSFI